MKKSKKGAWFIPVRWSYLPSSWQGWLLYAPYVSFLIFSFVAIDRNSHSISDTLIGIIPYWVAAAVVMQWIASHKS